ncbi:restriction endonuclease subunit S [Mycobacterium sp. ITM-2016-00317]|uniref:restriction endonuclease subunit S n=1 Tax=Mycobacterium sp. ITM-2016-00317 TaxID=2099694 RepID=UPI00287FB47B|nr:restriction endonuclease subunit S [Mycobacterium sp. ITM-2016-00317]WNG87747.1 restriction endonuclease subunit S [Mycobacterium sp. ITM-2016-00317]
MKQTTLGTLMVKRAGSVDPSKFPDEKFDLYSIPAHDHGSAEILAGTDIGSSKQVVSPGDVLLSRIVPHIRRAWIVGQSRGRRIIASGEWIVFRSDSADPRWLRHYLLGDTFHRQFMQTVAGVGGSLLRARPAQVANIQIAIPELDEQRRVAAILDHADILRTARLRTTTLAEEAGRAVFLEMFGRYVGEYVTIDHVALPEKGSIRTGPFGSQLLHSEFVPEGISVLGLDNVVGNSFTWGERRFITPEKYELLKRYTVQPGDVLVSIMGTCGRCVVVPQDVGTAINTKHICAITLDPCVALPEFVRASFLWHPTSRAYLTRQTKGAIMDGLNMGIIKQMPLPLPSLDEQQQFVTRLNSIDGLSDRLGGSSEQLGELFASLQYRAFSGQL